ncbi:MAG TPA: hypothetical protein DCS43_15555 [Verrucomicrobia bacterium]|nr:hypothetical protein [Verrucomicrobiota bacterium]
MRHNHYQIAVCLASAMLGTINPGLAADEPRLSAITQQCKAAGWEDTTIGKLNGVLADGMDSGVDLDVLTLRLQEGLAKKVDPARVVDAVGTRLGAMKQARTLAKAHDCTSDELEQTVGFALEAGLSGETISRLLTNGSKQRPGQLVALIDASRTLVLGGWEEQAAFGLASDFQERNLRRSEMIRAVRTLSEMGPSPSDQLPKVRARLWGGGGPSGTSAGHTPAGAQKGMGMPMDPGGKGGGGGGGRRGGSGESGRGAGQ